MNVKPKVVQTLINHVFFPSFLMDQCITNALQLNMINPISPGALLKLIVMDITSVANGDSVTEIVSQVEI